MYFNVANNDTYNGTTSAVAYVTVDDLYGPNASDFIASVHAALPSYAAAIAARNNNATSEFWGTMPFARGSVHINAAASPVGGNQAAAAFLPLADPAYWMFDYDTSLQVAASRYVRKLYLHTAPLRDLVASEGYPGLGAVAEGAGDDEWARWSKRHMRSAYHGIGSAIMLPREKGGMVDPRCRVYGTPVLSRFRRMGTRRARYTPLLRGAVI